MNSAINQKANAITSSVSETYATKQSVTDVSNNLANNYSTTSAMNLAMNSAIQQKANEINQTVSETYATKESVSETYATKESVTDINDNLSDNYSTTTQMNSAINQKANAITSSVSETYATKQSVTDVSNNLANNYSTTSAMNLAMNSAIQQKANEINQTVSETYATKQSVTNVSNNLANNYSTTTQMNSAINQKANAITSSVSETYATKESVSETYATKESVTDINDNLSANYPTTTQMNSAITQKANAITSSVSETYATKQSVTNVSNNLANNYSTTTQMNSAINQKANAITSSVSETYATKTETNSSVQQTAADLTATFTEMHNGGYSQGITAINKDGIKVSQSNYSGYTHMSASGFYVNNGSENVISCTSSGLVVKGNITATSGKIANFTISGNDLIGSNVGMGGASGTNQAFWAGSNTSSSAPFRVGHDGALVATNANITGTVNATAGTFSGNIVTNNIVKAYNSVYAGAEVWGGFTLNSQGSYVSSQTFTVHSSAALQIDGNPTRISSVTGEVKIGDASSYNNLRAREIYAQEIIYTDDLRTRSANQLSLSNVSMMSENAFIEFSSGHGTIRVPDATHLYLQTGGGAGNTSSEVRCTSYKSGTTYVNLRAYNLCAQNAVYANGVNVSSDRERKRDIELYSTDALNEICTTPVYTYHLDTDLDEEVKRIGIIMQEAPLDAIDLSGKGVDLYQMVTMLWRAVQQQQEMINELKGE